MIRGTEAAEPRRYLVHVASALNKMRPLPAAGGSPVCISMKWSACQFTSSLYVLVLLVHKQADGPQAGSHATSRLWRVALRPGWAACAGASWHPPEREGFVGMQIIPDIRERTELEMIGTPLTHARYLRRHKGTYGPGISAREATFPGPATPIPGLYGCGDSYMPGIGVPAAAASGMIAANTLVSVPAHFKMLSELQL